MNEVSPSYSQCNRDFKSLRRWLIINVQTDDVALYVYSRSIYYVKKNTNLKYKLQCNVSTTYGLQFIIEQVNKLKLLHRRKMIMTEPITIVHILIIYMHKKWYVFMLCFMVDGGAIVLYSWPLILRFHSFFLRKMDLIKRINQIAKIIKTNFTRYTTTYLRLNHQIKMLKVLFWIFIL